VQADAPSRLNPDGLLKLNVKSAANQGAGRGPTGAGPSLISLLYLTATISGTQASASAPGRRWT
jgi:hypothetical protein